MKIFLKYSIIIIYFFCSFVSADWKEKIYSRYGRKLAGIYKYFEPGLHISRKTVYDWKKLKSSIQFAKKAGFKSITLDVKTTGGLTSFKKVKQAYSLCKKSGMRVVGRWVMFKYWRTAPGAFTDKNGNRWRGENCSFSNPVKKYSWDYNFYGIYKSGNKRIRRYGIIHYMKYLDEIELDYIRYPTRNLSNISFLLNNKVIRKNLSSIYVTNKKIKKILRMSRRKKKQYVLASFLNYYLSKKEFKHKISLDIIGSVLLQCQNIGQYNLIGKYMIRPMLYLDRQHIPKNDLLCAIKDSFSRTKIRTYDDLYYFATYSYLNAGIRKYRGRKKHSKYILPYIKGWHNSGESTHKTLAEFVGQLKALKALKIKRFTIWSLGRTVSRLLLLANRKKVNVQLAHNKNDN